MGTKVFISYKSEYRDFARKVQQRLRDWGYETWFDMDDIPKGAYFRHAIQEGLDTSDVLVGVMTQEAFQSREVMAEWDYFLSQDKDVVPLKYRECKPLYHLVTIQWIDFTANERQGFAQLRDSLQRIIAAPEPAPEAEEKRDDVDEQIAQIEREAPKPPALDDLLIMPPATYAPGSPAPQPAAPPAPITPMPAAPVTKPPADTGSGYAAPPPPIQSELKPNEPASAAGTGYIPPLPTAPQQMAARKSANRWLRPLAALAAVLLVGVVGVALIGGLGTPPNMALTQPGGIASWLLPVIALIAAGAGYWYVARRRAAATATVDARTQQTNRQRMLDKVEEFWVKGVLENALAESGAFDLGLAAVPGATLRHRDYGDYPLPSSASIGDVFDDMQRELLILGAPGAGKTILLLSLARELLSRARADSKLPIPVVFNLSSWAAERKSLDEWLVDELRLKYQAPRRVAEGWLVSDLLNKSASAARRQAQALVTGEQLTLLLDGLDEVAAAHRDACVEAINAFRVAHPQVDIAVCSRSADYDLLTSKLDLRGAVVLQPLSEAQINTYLDRPQLGALRETLPSDAALREMAATPFLLNTMAAAYQGASAASLRLPTSDDPLKARRTHLFDAFVQKRLYSDTPRYAPAQTRQYLAWLAGRLVQFGQSAFYIESLQPGWLSSRNARIRYRISLLISIVFFTLFIAASWVFISDTIFSLVAEQRLRSLDQIAYFATNMMLCTLPFALILGMAAFFRKAIFMAENVKFAITWSSLLVSIVFGLLGALVASIDSSESNSNPIIGFVVIGAAFLLITSWRLSENVTMRVQPNQGIRETTRNAVVGMFGAGLAIVIAIAITFPNVIEFAVFFGANLGLIIGFAGFGGFSVVQHIVLRTILFLARRIPWNYARFLDYCASAGLLRKVGGGYLFAHRYLLEYFAERDGQA